MNMCIKIIWHYLDKTIPCNNFLIVIVTWCCCQYFESSKFLICRCDPVFMLVLNQLPITCKNWKSQLQFCKRFVTAEVTIFPIITAGKLFSKFWDNLDNRVISVSLHASMRFSFSITLYSFLEWGSLRASSFIIFFERTRMKNQHHRCRFQKQDLPNGMLFALTW